MTGIRASAAVLLCTVVLTACGVTEEAEPEPLDVTVTPAPTPTVTVVPDTSPALLPRDPTLPADPSAALPGVLPATPSPPSP